MSSIAALIKKNVILKSGHSAADAVAALRKAGQDFAVVLDEDKSVLGCFSYGMLLEETMPVSLSIGAGEDATSISLPGAPGLARRLQRNLAAPITAVMRRPEQMLDAEDSLDAAAQAVRMARGPVIVADRTTGAFMGIITEDSLLAALERPTEQP